MYSCTVQYSTVQLYRVQVHTTTSPETGDNLSRVDLAVVRVEGSISLATHTPLCLPQPGMEVRGGNITLAGQQTLNSLLSSPAVLSGWGLVTCPHAEHNPGCAGGKTASVLQVQYKFALL